MIGALETAETINCMHANFDAMSEELIAADITIEEMINALRKIRETE